MNVYHYISFLFHFTIISKCLLTISCQPHFVPKFTKMKGKDISVSFNMDLTNTWTDDISNVKLFVDHDDMLEVLKCVLGNAVRVSPTSSTIIVDVSLVPSSEDFNATSGDVIDVAEGPIRCIGALQIEVVDRGPGLSQVHIAQKC